MTRGHDNGCAEPGGIWSSPGGRDPSRTLLLAVLESDTWVVGARRGNERAADGGPAAGDMSERDSVDVP